MCRTERHESSQCGIALRTEWLVIDFYSLPSHTSVWVKGRASQVSAEELPTVLENYCNRPFPETIEREPEGLSPADLLSKTHLRWFQVIPHHVYVRDTGVFDRDRRREVPLP